MRAKGIERGEGRREVEGDRRLSRSSSRERAVRSGRRCSCRCSRHHALMPSLHAASAAVRGTAVRGSAQPKSEARSTPAH